VPDHADDSRVDQLLRHRGAHFRVCLVVLGHQRELHRLPADFDFRFVRLVDREPRPVLVVLAEMGDAAGERGDVADANFGTGGRRGGGRTRCLGFGLCRRLLFAAAHQRHRRRDERNADLVVHGISRGV
jgi:hypothetical protein